MEQRHTWLAEGMKTYKRDREMVEPLLLRCTSSATTVQKVKDFKG